MKKTAVILAAMAIALSPALAQKKYEKIRYQNVTSDMGEFVITAKDILSMEKETKFKLKIENKSDQILIYKPEESVLKASGQEVRPKEKWLVIQPINDGSRVINFLGSQYMIPSYSYLVDGLYKVSDKDVPVQTPDFSLPPSRNDFKTGGFSCTMTDLNKETAKTTVKFECRYTGSKIGIINAGRAAVKLPDGTEIANAKAKAESEVLMRGEAQKITLQWDRMEGGKATDMQKIKMDILWRDTFVEADPVKLGSVNLEMKIDEAQSK